MRRIGILVWLLGAALFAQAPLTVKADSFAEHTIGTVTAVDAKPNAAFSWFVMPVSPLPQNAASKIIIKNELRFTGPPGQYVVLCFEVTILNGVPEIRQTDRLVTITPSQQPNPPPNPQPQPNPPNPSPTPPTPVEKIELVAVVIEESAEAWAGRGLYFSDPTLDAFLKANGHVLRVSDQNSVVNRADWIPYLKAAQGKKLPVLFLVPKTGGTARYADALPTQSPQALIDLIKAKGGKG